MEKLNDQRQDNMIMTTIPLRKVTWYDGTLPKESEDVWADFGGESVTIDLPVRLILSSFVIYFTESG